MFIVKAQKIETVHPKAYHDGISKGYIKLANNPIPEQKNYLAGKGQIQYESKKIILQEKGISSRTMVFLVMNLHCRSGWRFTGGLFIKHKLLF